jgi:hypothetical protein
VYNLPTNMQSKAALEKFSGGERQLEIYQAGLMSAKATVPVSPDMLEQKAREALEARAYD